MSNRETEEEQKQTLRAIHWQKTRRLAVITLMLWLFVAVGIHLLVFMIEPTRIFGFTPSFYMAAQGSILLFVLLVFWFTAMQERIDRLYGTTEDE